MSCTPISSIVSTSTTSSVTIVMAGEFGDSGLTYAQFLASIGVYSYGVEFFYLSATDYRQIGQPVLYNHFDANGNSISAILPFYVDPYQSQPSLYYEVESSQIIFTLLTSLQFVIFANNTVFFKLFATITYLGNEFDNTSFVGGDNAFEEFEISQAFRFFADYCDYLIDNE
jgi:hypothetical protein